MSSIERRYATALMQASKSKEEQIQIDKDLSEVAKMYTSNLQFKKILLDPRLDKSIKSGIVKEIFIDNNPLMVSFVSLLIDKNRVNCLSGIANEYSELTRKMNNELKINIVSATDLSNDEIGGITDKYKKLYGASKVSYDLSVDESLIGGVKVVVGNKVYDGSVKTQLRNML